jgi:hypothetical protein
MLKAMGAADGQRAQALRTRTQLTEALVLHILFLDLEDYSRNKTGVKNKSLTKSALVETAQVWKDYHPSAFHQAARKELAPNLPYATLWNVFKRTMLQDCGLHVVTAPSKRVYFEQPHNRPRGPHDAEKDGRWRQPVLAPSAYQPAPDDAEDVRDRQRDRTFVRSATFEQGMGGAGGQSEFEAPVPVDDEALDCPDRGTKVEWDALWPVEHLVERKAIGQVDGLNVDDERLRWVRPVSQGGVTAPEYIEALHNNPNPVAAAEAPVRLQDLDPTQRAFADLVLTWAHSDASEFCAVLLGTAGTGKTTTLQAVLEVLRQEGFNKFLVAAFTGVAASNVGGGARTLHDLFQLAKVNATSGELQPLQGADLEQLASNLDNLRLLVIDEVSMVSRTMLADIDMRLKEWRAFRKHPLKHAAFGGVGIVLAGDFGQLPPTKAEHLSLLCPNVLHGHLAKQANFGLRLFQRFTTVVRLRRIHRQPGASQYKESLIRLRDGAMTKEDHALWSQHDLAADPPTCQLGPQERTRFEDRVTHLFAENAGAGERNGVMAGRLAEDRHKTILRVASRDSTAAASRQACDMFGQLRRVVHLVEGAPVMIICNLRTPAGLVNGARGKVVGVVLRRDAADRDLRKAVSASDVKYVVVDVPKYCGPVIYPGHPTFVPIEPTTVRHKRMKGWERLQLPLVLAWGITIHKSQGLTFPEGAAVDFAHHPNTQPVANPGLAFVAMSRTCAWADQAFRNLPDFWEFRKILQNKLFKWRSALEERMDAAHDRTMALVWGRSFDAEEDVRRHQAWSERKLERSLTDDELRDIKEMLGVRGLRKAPDYTDEPQEGRNGLKGGGGRKLAMGMKPLPAKRSSRNATAAVRDASGRADPDVQEASHHASLAVPGGIDNRPADTGNSDMETHDSGANTRETQDVVETRESLARGVAEKRGNETTGSATGDEGKVKRMKTMSVAPDSLTLEGHGKALTAAESRRQSHTEPVNSGR